MNYYVCVLFLSYINGFPMHFNNSQSISFAPMMQDTQTIDKLFEQDQKNFINEFDNISDFSTMEKFFPALVNATEVKTNNSKDMVMSHSMKEYVTNPELTTRASVPARQEEEEDEEEGGGGLGGLLTSFLGSLSTPEGGVDLDAVTGLLGGISTQNDDGTYDFTGLQDTVGSLFGGSEEGGSNVGLFLGGLLGAIIRGSAGDDAAKGAGRLGANLLAALLPGLSAYPTPEEEDGEPGKTPQGLDSGGFLTGFLSTFIGASGNSSNSNSSGGGAGNDKDGGKGPFLQLKVQLVKSLLSVVTKIISASSAKTH